MIETKQRKRASPRGDATRERILDAAEKLFAERGYDATSVRDICAEARTELGTFGYHFRSKDEIFSQVIQRRTAGSTAGIRANLERVIAERGDQLTTEDVLGAFMEQIFESLRSGNPGEKNYLRIVTQRMPIESTGKLHPATAVDYIPVRTLYLRALRKTLPGVPSRKLDWSFSIFELSFGSALFSATQERFATANATPAQLRDLQDSHLKFFAAGFHALAREHAQKKQAAPKKEHAGKKRAGSKKATPA
jgi:AcrR family transcriptional regulator